MEEIAALSPFQPVSVLLKDMARKAVLADKRNPNRPVGVFELTPNQQGATFWSALTDDATASDDFWSLASYLDGFLNSANGTYPTITAYVLASNVAGVAWLERIGFQFVEDVSRYGRKELPFKFFTRNR